MICRSAFTQGAASVSLPDSWGKEMQGHKKRSTYLTALMIHSPEWIRGSMANPTRYMTRMHVLLHAVALRRMRAN